MPIGTCNRKNDNRSLSNNQKRQRHHIHSDREATGDEEKTASDAQLCICLDCLVWSHTQFMHNQDIMIKIVCPSLENNVVDKSDMKPLVIRITEYELV